MARAAAMKELAAQMAKEYLPKEVESGWYPWWENNFFAPRSDLPETAKKFVIVLPPPNVTGFLHLGHALTGAVQDALVRWHRMKGHVTLYVPGTDHAGIATQVVAEKKLKAQTGKSRHDLGRSAFVDLVWKYKAENCGMIQRQLRLTGASLDWTRERFTMDSMCANAVVEAFVRLHEQGLVYRATRIVNWCCALQSAISDLEVDYEDVEKNSKLTVPNFDRKVDAGMLTMIAYKFVDSDEEIVVGTTRPETLLGDTAIAVHPADERYKKFHGQRLTCPFRNDQIPLVTDDKLVDMAFGTGAVKVTPAHDPNDFECGVRNNLQQLNIFDLNGHITIDGPFKGQHRFECRKQIVAALEAKGLLRGTEGYSYRIGRCCRTGDVVEPMLLPQWFVNCSSMAASAVDAVRTKKLRIIPSTHETTWYHFLENIKPWCVSRQLWWGHRIPAYECILDNKKMCAPGYEWIVARDQNEARKKAKEAFQLTDEQAADIELQQDPDVLDTWFSSALWPFSVMGWPNETPDFQKFFPGSLLETGHDIIFFWVARMVMTGLHFTGKLPFTEIYLHAMVRDKEGRKMSKSLGNVIDPLDVIYGISLEKLHEKVQTGNLDPKEVPRAIKFQKEAFKNGIPECGSDALRFGLLSYTQSGRNVNLDIDRIVGYRQFGNKLWNAVRYVLYHCLGEKFEPLPLPLPGDVAVPIECAWICSRLDQAIAECNSGFTEGQYDFAAVTNAAFHFWLHELCDVFIELTKAPFDPHRKHLVQSILLYCVERGLRMLHPMMPFLTEELWHYLPGADNHGYSIMVSPYPEPSGWASPEVDQKMKQVLDVVHLIRSIKASYQLPTKIRPDIWILCSTNELELLFAASAISIQVLSSIGNVAILPTVGAKDVPSGCVIGVASAEVAIHVMLKGIIDVERENAKLQKTIQGIQKQIQNLTSKINAPKYVENVPIEIQRQNSAKLEVLNGELAQAMNAVESLKAMR